MTSQAMIGVVIGFAVRLVREIGPVARRDDPDQRIDMDEARIGEILPDRLAGGDVRTGKREVKRRRSSAVLPNGAHHAHSPPM